ncbi:VanZ family protein [Vibrio chagasii]|uniref:VanZ family protein n=1 Tax=Vibrio chagasii TaxID=170679 RepID=UPI0037362371
MNETPSILLCSHSLYQRMVSITAKLALLCVLIGIWYLSLTPRNPTTVMSFEGIDKIKHACAYCVLGLTTFIALPQRFFFMTLTGFWIMSGGIELLQGIQVGRHASFYDWLANFLGLGLAYGVSLVHKRYRNLPT